MTVWLPYFSQILLSVKCSCRHVFSGHAFLYIDIIYIYTGTHTHMHTPFLDVFNMYSKSCSKWIGVELWCFLSLTSSQQTCTRKIFVDVWRLFADIWAVLMDCEQRPGCEFALLWVLVLIFSYGRWHEDPFSDKSGNEDVLSDWQNVRKELFRALCGLFQLEYTRMAREVERLRLVSHGVLHVPDMY